MKAIEERTFTIKRGVLPSSLAECPRMIAVVGNGPQLGNFRGHYYRAECGACVCLRSRASGDGARAGHCAKRYNVIPQENTGCGRIIAHGPGIEADHTVGEFVG